MAECTAWQWGDNPGFTNYFFADPARGDAMVVFQMVIAVPACTSASFGPSPVKIARDFSGRSGAIMQSESKGPTTVDEYLAAFSPAVQSVLQRVRETIRAAAPDAVEKISYRMPSYHGHGALVYFGGFKEHVGLYPPVKDEALRVASARYAGPKGNLRFPLSEPMPLGLITKLVKARVREDREHAKRAQAKRAQTKPKTAK